MVFDLETSALEPWAGEIIMFSFAHDLDNRGYSVPLIVNNEVKNRDQLPDTIIINPVEFEVTPSQRAGLLLLLGKLLKRVPIVGHNLKFDIRWVHYHQVARLDDIKILDDTLNLGFQCGHRSGSLSLKTLSRKYVSADNWEWDLNFYLSKIKRVVDRSFDKIPTSMLGKYAACDAYFNNKLYHILKDKIDSRARVVSDLVRDVILPFAEAEVKGFSVDIELAQSLETSCSDKAGKLLHTIRSLPVIQKFVDLRKGSVYAKNSLKKKPKEDEALWKDILNIKSNAHLTDLMYGSGYFCLPVTKEYMTKGGKTGKPKPATSKAAITFFNEKFLTKARTDKSESWAQAREFLDNLLLYKRLQKLLSTYIGPIKEESALDGKYRGDFSLNYVVTGRLSSGFHTMDKRSDTTRMFISRWRDGGGLIYAPDMSQLEIRIGASLAQEMSLIDAYVLGFDIHQKTASEIFGVPFDQVTKAQRNKGKVVNFSIFYGKTAHGLSIDLGISIEEAQEMLTNFFQSKSSLKEWIDIQHNQIRMMDFIITKWGRIIPVIGGGFGNAEEELRNLSRHNRGEKVSIGDVNFSTISQAKRQCVNYAVQSASSDVVLWGIRETWRENKREKHKSIMVGSVHDSIELDVYPGELITQINLFKNVFEQRVRDANPWIICPLELSTELGTSWGGCIEMHTKELGDKHVVLEGTALKRDWIDVIETAKKCYSVEYKTLDVKGLTDSDFEPHIFVRDTEKWTGQISIST